MKALWHFILELFLFHKRTHHTGSGLQFLLTLPGGITIRSHKMDISISAVDAPFTLAVIGTDAKGNPTPPPAGAVGSWTNSADNIATSVFTDLSTTVSPVGPVGTDVITVTIDGMMATANVTVVAGPMVAIDFAKS